MVRLKTMIDNLKSIILFLQIIYIKENILYYNYIYIL